MDEKNKEKVKEEEIKPVVSKEKPAKKSGSGKYVGTIIVALFSGVVIGLVTGVLLAPKKGQQTRKEITDRSRELIDKSKKTITDTLDKTKEISKESKSKFDRVIDIIAPKKKKGVKENKEVK